MGSKKKGGSKAVKGTKGREGPPKGPLTSYLLWLQENKEEITKKSKSRKVWGEMWKELDDKSKQKWKDLAKKKREEYEEEWEEYEAGRKRKQPAKDTKSDKNAKVDNEKKEESSTD